MAMFSLLLDQMTPPETPQMQAEGYAVWMVWDGELNPVVPQAMQDYGGLLLASEPAQALWFFFSTDVFLASARLETWAKFNTLPVSLSVMPVTLLAGAGRRLALALAPETKAQEAAAPKNFQVWVHESATPIVASMPGITLEEGELPPGMHGAWLLLHADSRLPYQASLGWYALLRPLGNPLDKTFQTGWRGLFEEVESILQRNKFRYTIHDFFLLFPLETLRQFKSWINDYLTLIDRLKEETPDKYWPCALAVVDKKGMSFNNELPKKIPLDWGQLAADYPHMNFRNALLLGGGFTTHEVRFATGNSPDDWCNVSLVQEGKNGAVSLPLLVPGSLVLGQNPQCFYCGQRGHELTACPTRKFPATAKDIWRRVAVMDMPAMKEGVRGLDEAVIKQGPETLHTLMEQESTVGIMTRALYDIAACFQVREINRFWRTRGKLPTVADDLAPEDNNPIWDLLSGFADADKLVLDKNLQTLALRFPRDFRIRSLQGFAALERGDIAKASVFWKEAEGLSPAGFIQAWHMVLQGRAAEYASRFSQAMLFYDQALRACPQWLDPVYRKIVCQVKTGFADQALTALFALLQQDANYFNRALLDTEMERGQIQILSGLGTAWALTESRMQEEKPMLERLRVELASWFTPEHPFAAQAAERILRLQDMIKFHNYVPYQAAIQGRIGLERDMQQLVGRESREFRNSFKSYLEKLAHIRDEAAWFPFPRIMVEFNKNYNQCAVSLNWAMRTNLNTPDAFRRAQVIAVAEEERIAKLEKRLRFLRLIRDTTLFSLTLLRTFFWLEIAGLLLVLVALPLLIFYGEKSGADWGLQALVGQRAGVQKAATFIVSFLALGIALLRTVLRFERVRDTVLEKARQEQARPRPAPKTPPKAAPKPPAK